MLKEQINSLVGATKKNSESLTAKADKTELDDLNLGKIVSSGKKNVDVTLYGQVDRALLFADNGDDSSTYFVDNENSNTRLGVKAKAKVNDDIGIGGKIEYAVRGNSSDKVNQFNKSTGAEIAIRRMDFHVSSKQMGTLSLGQSSSASDGTAEVDYSGTGVVVYSGIGDIAGGTLIDDPGVELTEENGLKIGKTVGNMDGLSRHDRVRYDSPSFGGFSFATSAIEKDAYDVAGRFEKKFGGSKIGAAVAWASGGDLKKFDDQVDGSISFLHSSGFNITFAGGQQNYDEGDHADPNYWYSKLGYRANLTGMGDSAFSVDYGQWNDFHHEGDETTSIGIGFVQNVSKWATQFYLAYRMYDLDSDGHDYDSINAVMGGARIKF